MEECNMFDKLEDLLLRYSELMQELATPEVTGDQNSSAPEGSE